METPPDHKLFRRWYVEAVVTQLRNLAAGREPEPVTPFTDTLVEEIRRLASAHRAAERAGRLLQVTAALARTRTPEDVAAVVVTEGVDVLGASGGGLLVPAADGRHLAVPGAVGYESGLVDALREELIDAPLPAATALRTGEAIWLESREERDRYFPALLGFEASTVSMCAVPLSVAGQVLGALRFSFDERRLFDEDERGFVLALAAQTAQTLQRTELYEAERRAAVDLQRALLPTEIPQLPGWEIATHYSPAGDQEAGGDFYDVMEVADGRFAAVVGDVMGRGLDGGGVDGPGALDGPRLRRRGPRPGHRVPPGGRVLRRDPARPARDHGLPADRSRRRTRCRWPSPATCRRCWSSDDAQMVSTKAEPPFGVGRPDRHALTLTLDQGDCLVLITDGLVERRGEDIDEGIGRVLAAAAASSVTSADQLLEADPQCGSEHRGSDDDVTVLVLRRVPGS